MNHVADVSAENHQRQRAENRRALCGYHPAHVGEHADGGKGNYEGHQLVNDRVEGGNNIPAQLGLLAGRHDSAAKQQGNDNDLQHIGLREGLPHIRGEDGHQRAHEARVLLGLILGGLRRFGKVGEQACVVEQRSQHKADDAGDGGGDHEVGHCLPAHGADLLHVAHGDDTVDHGKQHHRHHNELQQVYENITERLEVTGGELCGACKIQHQTHHDAQNQG